MRTWKKQQYNKNRKYLKKSQSDQTAWRKKYPADQYQRDYREAHPEYVIRNRELQMSRNKKRRKDPSTMIVKTYALLTHPAHDGMYPAFDVKNGKIVKTYTLLSQMQVQDAVEAFFPPNTV